MASPEHFLVSQTCVVKTNVGLKDNELITKAFRALGTGIGTRDLPLFWMEDPKDTQCLVNMEPVKRSGSTIK